ncbi:MAG: hypothetical protein H0U53_11010 [Actinobacteria bacterium]|nr:hypothetical protein [Actinomycetota bacterium]
MNTPIYSRIEEDMNDMDENTNSHWIEGGILRLEQMLASYAKFEELHGAR